jgi:hypothetical protein
LGGFDGGEVAEDHGALLAFLGAECVEDSGGGVSRLGGAAGLELGVALERGESDRGEPGEPLRGRVFDTGGEDVLGVGDHA